MRVRWFVAWVTVGLAACGSSSSGDVDAAGNNNNPRDAATNDAVDVADAAPACGVTWDLVTLPIMDLRLIDPAPINTARTTRVTGSIRLSGCDQRAMPVVRYDNAAKEAFVEMRIWRANNATCPNVIEIVERPVSVQLGVEGTWDIYPVEQGGGTGTPIQVTVGPAPERTCGGVSGCEMDCDCAAGEKCLGGNGFGGPFTGCARPCELPRDCLGDGSCTSATDGLAFYCDSGFEECNGSTTCEPGYDCSANVCEPDFLLGAATRKPCNCDAECDAPLRCIESQVPGRGRSCELACQTGSAGWCSIMHYCGSAAEDVAGIAPADSVCVWPGE